MDDNSFKIDKKYAKHYGFLVVVAVIWVGVNVWFITSWNRLPAFAIITTALSYPAKKYADKRFPLTELTDNEKQVQVTITLAEYKRLRELRNDEYDRDTDNTNKKATHFRKSGK